MSGLQAVVYFSLWTLLLVVFYSGYRVIPILRGTKKPNAWTRGGAVDEPGVITRTHHAHLNALETLPIFAAVVLAGAALGKPAPANAVGEFIVVLRVAQSVIHMISTSPMMVLLRAVAFFAQILLILWMIRGILAG
ncbi:MAG: hypothetical protein B7Z75_09745 [Acidocella sp. 20-57-95]|nr:MAG: hypothetical protein B7Z75_09745 [Acidocella sp. 20-57-95]OYV60922.1 MAG: hypothetical protein B7Z71_05425 [Acidocella sp. 21-58-7]HQT64999.1 MAPEG family protein [Acidocella sp.]HQU04018.1 MAPEG family protein [Acidocella sp.]